jgi:hypothetical protein
LEVDVLFTPGCRPVGDSRATLPLAFADAPIRCRLLPVPFFAAEEAVIAVPAVPFFTAEEAVTAVPAERASNALGSSAEREATEKAAAEGVRVITVGSAIVGVFELEREGANDPLDVDVLVPEWLRVADRVSELDRLGVVRGVPDALFDSDSGITGVTEAVAVAVVVDDREEDADAERVVLIDAVVVGVGVPVAVGTEVNVEELVGVGAAVNELVAELDPVVVAVLVSVIVAVAVVVAVAEALLLLVQVELNEAVVLSVPSDPNPSRMSLYVEYVAVLVFVTLGDAVAEENSLGVAPKPGSSCNENRAFLSAAAKGGSLSGCKADPGFVSSRAARKRPAHNTSMITGKTYTAMRCNSFKRDSTTMHQTGRLY